MILFCEFSYDHDIQVPKLQYLDQNRAKHLTHKHTMIPEQEKTGDGPEKKITRLAIGVEGGFDPECGKPKFTYSDHYNVVVLPGLHQFPYPDPALPEQVKNPYKRSLMPSPHLNWLKWPPYKVPGTVEHYRETGYPLAVKLGTITADGKADVYSYAEDDMVIDPHLVEHLKHFGINIQQMQKTEKSMVELELELNQRSGEWTALQEAGSELRPLAGPGLTGINNLGNTCYINSVMQVLFRIPDFVRRFVEGAPEIFATFPEDPVNDFNVQTAKLGVGLLSGRYARLEEGGSQAGISPHMFRNLVGKDHPEFMTKRQQDAHEFYLHFLNLLESRHKSNPAEALTLRVEERVRCGESGRVRYTRRSERHIPLPVPLAAADNAAAVRDYEQKRAQAEHSGQKLMTPASFPDYLLVQLKFTIRRTGHQLNWMSASTCPGR
ncbi:Ubiquitin carboxyl-terminal hydrolase 5 [Eumeta japonica]|uniref:ubiquitinyl hydrolase 1 n=1 Tax=Eumeta variegata TaxID=151549 RepID=A0A4C1Z739_EUMVA|nr:Ubiquitin carboxyl-terminal hydrolase 5 [Eumeta japonica]